MSEAMHPAAFEAPGARWGRFSRYILENGFIRPARGAQLETYSPWQLYRESADLKDGADAPHRALLALLPQLNRQALDEATTKLLLEWCSKYGLLGVALQKVQMVVLAPRWMRSVPGMAISQEPGSKLIQLVARQLVRDPRGWSDTTQTSLKPYLSDAIDDGQLVTADFNYPAKWRESGWDHPWVLRASDNGVWVRESISTTWGRYFPDVPEDERETFSYPTPASPEFWSLYAEPIPDFLQAASSLYRVLDVFRTMSARRDRPKIDEQLAHHTLRQIDTLFSSIHPCLMFDDEGVPQLQWNSPSLLGSMAMMAAQDLLAGKKILLCGNETCKQLFLAQSYQVKFCSDRCRQAVQKRTYRARLRAKERKHKGKTAPASKSLPEPRRPAPGKRAKRSSP